MFGPFSTLSDFLTWLENRIRSDKGNVAFAVLDKTQSADHQFAGTIGLLNTSPDHLHTEVAFVFTLPPFQRTHVTTHAIGLLLQWCFEELKLRRVQWQANECNEKSWKAAMKMGFTKEGVSRWQMVLPVGKLHGGLLPREGDPKPDCPGRHSIMLAVCWDDWENGVKLKVQERMALQGSRTESLSSMA
jgi:RimJ/RimL family protein N-acetyltransferase